MRAQVHGMGLENAQICAAISNNDYYEQLIMNEEQIKGLDKLGPLAIVDGNLTVSDEPGLGYHYDWAELDATRSDEGRSDRAVDAASQASTMALIYQIRYLNNHREEQKMTMTFNRRSALKLGGSLLAASALTAAAGLRAGDDDQLLAHLHQPVRVRRARRGHEALCGGPPRHHGRRRRTSPTPNSWPRSLPRWSPDSRPNVTGVSSERFQDLRAMGALLDITDRVASWERRGRLRRRALHRDHRTTARSMACRPSRLSTGSTTARTGSTRPASPCRRRLPNSATPRSS